MIDSWTFNKIAGAVLGTALVVFGLSELSGLIYATHPPEKPGLAIEVAETTGGGEAPAVEEKPLAELLASADVAKGDLTEVRVGGQAVRVSTGVITV